MDKVSPLWPFSLPVLGQIPQEMSHKHSYYLPRSHPLEDTECLRTTWALGPKFTAKTKPTQSQLYKYDWHLGPVVSYRLRLLCGVPMWRGPFTTKKIWFPGVCSATQLVWLPASTTATYEREKKSFLFHVKKYKYYIIDSERKCAERELKVHWSEPRGWLMGWDLRTVLEWKQMLFCTKEKGKFAFLVKTAAG